MVVDVNPEGDPFLGRPRALLEVDSWDSFDVSPDGGRLIVDKSQNSLSPAGTLAPPTELNLVPNWPSELERLVPMDE